MDVNNFAERLSIELIEVGNPFYVSIFPEIREIVRQIYDTSVNVDSPEQKFLQSIEYVKSVCEDSDRQKKIEEQRDIQINSLKGSYPLKYQEAVKLKYDELIPYAYTSESCNEYIDAYIKSQRKKEPESIDIKINDRNIDFYTAAIILLKYYIYQNPHSGITLDLCFDLFESQKDVNCFDYLINNFQDHNVANIVNVGIITRYWLQALIKKDNPSRYRLSYYLDSKQKIVTNDVVRDILIKYDLKYDDPLIPNNLIKFGFVFGDINSDIIRGKSKGFSQLKENSGIQTNNEVLRRLIQYETSLKLRTIFQALVTGKIGANQFFALLSDYYLEFKNSRYKTYIFKIIFYTFVVYGLLKLYYIFILYFENAPRFERLEKLTSWLFNYNFVTQLEIEEAKKIVNATNVVNKDGWIKRFLIWIGFVPRTTINPKTGVATGDYYIKSDIIPSSSYPAAPLPSEVINNISGKTSNKINYTTTRRINEVDPSIGAEPSPFGQALVRGAKYVGQQGLRFAELFGQSANEVNKILYDQYGRPIINRAGEIISEIVRK